MGRHMGRVCLPKEHVWIKVAVMKIEKAMIAYMFQKYPENFEFQIFIILQ